jgi:hypothetical protein
MQAAIDARTPPLREGQGPSTGVTWRFLRPSAEERVTGHKRSDLNSTYRDGHFGVSEFVAFLAREIPGALLFVGANLGFAPTLSTEIDT